MSDVRKYLEKRCQTDPEFAENFESGYLHFKIGVLLRQAREAVGISQAEIAARLDLAVEKIDQIENQPEQVNLAILDQYADALGKKLSVELV